MEKVRNSFQFLKILSTKTKITTTQQGRSGVASFLGVVVNKEKYHIPVGQVREIIPRPQIVTIGHTKPWLSGLLKVQGEIYSVIDVSCFLGFGLTDHKGSIAIALSVNEGNYAILVSSVLGINKLNQLQQVDNDDYTVTYQTAEKETIPALSVPSILKSSELANMSIF